jgi:hypothetical protein
MLPIPPRRSRASGNPGPQPLPWIPALRCAPAGMTKKSDCCTCVPGLLPLLPFRGKVRSKALGIQKLMLRGEMTVAIPSAGSGRAMLRLTPYLGLLLAAIAVLLLALVPIGWRSGWWAYRFSLLTMMACAAYVGVAATLVSLLVLLFARRAIGLWGSAIALVALIAGGLTAYVPSHYRALARSVPPINDITTDTDNPPTFLALVPFREAAHSNPSTYAGAKTARLQKQGYPDIAPLALVLPPDRAFALVLVTAKEMGWTIIASDPRAGRIEADQRSLWMGFTDDIVVRVVNRR